MMKFAVSLVAVISMLFIAPMVYMLADDQPPYEYDAEASYIVPSQTVAGRQITVHWKFRRVNRICAGSITRHIVDDHTKTRVTYDPTPAASNVDVADESLDRTFFLPQGISAGRKWYYSDGEFACNPLQHFYPLRVRTPRLSFEVLQ